jgi:hypothetical protein
MTPSKLRCRRRESMLLGAILITGVLISSAGSQGKTVTAQTGEAELIETGGAGANFAMTEADYLAMMKQLSGSSALVPITNKPNGLSPQARFGINFVLGGLNRAWILDGDDALGYVLYADINANGDLGDDPPHKFELTDGRYSLRLRLLAKSEEGTETYPVIIKIVIDRVAPPGKDDKQLALLMYNRTRRSGQFVLESGGDPIPFTISGAVGIYDYEHNWISFDMNRDGTFDSEIEGYQISERYVNIGEKTYEFAVRWPRRGRPGPFSWRDIPRRNSALPTSGASPGDSLIIAARSYYWTSGGPGAGRVSHPCPGLSRPMKGIIRRVSRS